MMDCKEALSLVDGWESGAPIGEEATLALLGHIEGCPSCARSLHSLAPLLRREAGLGAPAPSASALRLADDVMARISEGGVRRATKAGPSPFFLLAAAAALAIGVGLALASGLRDAGSVTIRFVLEAPQATSVAVAGDFNRWKADGYELRRDKGGSWVLEVKLRKDKLYSYNFVIDGERWIPDPSSPETVDDGFGGSSSLIRI
jgi:hypothetical protein